MEKSSKNVSPVIRGGMAVFAVLLVLTEFATRWQAPRLWQSPQITETVSASLLRDRLRVLKDSRPAVAFLGDSVVYGSALREHGDPDWRGHTPAAMLREKLSARGLGVDSFAADGLYPLDMEALDQAAESLDPAAVVVELNYRMLSAEAGVSRTALVRPYLRGWLPQGLVAPPKGEERLAEVSGDALRDVWATWRYMELASYLALQPSLKERMEPLAAAFFPPRDESGDEDTRDALLDLKIRPYYQAPVRQGGHLGWESLERLAAHLRASGRPCLVFLTPQNKDRIAGVLDAAAYARNRRELGRIFASQGKVHWADWADRVPPGRFLDHCHLDPQGNAGLADWIQEELAHAL